MKNMVIKDRIQALKDKQTIKANILSLLHSNALVIAKKEKRDVSDADYIKASKALIKKNKQAIDLIIEKGGDISKTEGYKVENIILNVYVPIEAGQMTEGNIKTAVNDLLCTYPEDDRIKKKQGMYMKQLKEMYGTIIDMSFASKYISGKLK